MLSLVLLFIFSLQTVSSENTTLPDMNNTEVPTGSSNEMRYPFFLSLRHKDEGHKCGATLITYKYVLTPCHCVSTYDPDLNTLSIIKPSNFLVVGGSEKIDNQEAPGIQSRIVHKFYIHPECHYTIYQYENDFGMIEVEPEFDYSTRIQILSRFLVTKNQDYLKFLNKEIKKNPNGSFSVISWQGQQLVNTEVEIIPTDTCVQDVCESTFCTDLTSSFDYICAKLKNDFPNCSLDQGSILMQNNAKAIAVYSYQNCDKNSNTVRFSLIGPSFMEFYTMYNPSNKANKKSNSFILNISFCFIMYTLLIF